MGRIAGAFKAFFRIIKDNEFARMFEKLDKGELCEPASILALLQRQGRFIDFIQEDISGYGDAQIGGVARTIHQGCNRLLKEYITIEPVVKEEEGASITVPEGFDASTIKLVGNVTGNPPFKGTVAHHGWKISNSKIPAVPRGHDPSIIIAAEVEI